MRRLNLQSLQLELIATALLVSIAAGPWLFAQTEKLRQEEAEDYYRKWLREDVVYIITPEEKGVFEKLETPDERENFIEQFWKRRDPDPRTSENEFKMEHYRRIAYANEQFPAGEAGWKTDRGMIYIKFGPPDQVERYPTGGPYTRKPWEGGGRTSTFPFENWWYRYIPGMGSDIEIEFVDKTLSGGYKIALSPEEKDALLMVTGAGLTEGQGYGFATRDDRLLRQWISGLNSQDPFFMRRTKDMPLQRIEQYSKLQQAPKIQFNDLKILVTTSIHYEKEIPFEVGIPHFVMDENHLMLPLTVEVPLKGLTFQQEDASFYRAEAELYGVVKSLTGTTVAEFEDAIISELSPEQHADLSQRRAFYQKKLILKPGRYKAVLVLKDRASGKIGTVERGIAVPGVDSQNLSTSSVLLCHVLEPLKDPGADFETQFGIGPYKVIPALGGQVQGGSSAKLKVYFHVYNMAIDQALRRPELKVRFRLFQDAQVREIEKRNPIGYFTEDTAVVATVLDFRELAPGKYRCQIEVIDEVSGKSTQTEFRFSVLDT